MAPPTRRGSGALSLSANDLKLFRPPHTSPVKVWLPEPLDDRLQELAEHEGANRSKLIRDALFQHVYGSYRFAQMRNQKDGFFWDPPPKGQALKDEVRFSRSGTAPYNLGKNIVNVRAWLPPKLRDDLALLAANAGRTWSHYVREVLVFHFMGHRLLIETDAALASALKQPENEPSDDDDGA